MIDLSSDRGVLWATICGEAENQPWGGKFAVAQTVVNRRDRSQHRKQFGDGTIRGAALAPYQFSCWNGLLDLFTIPDTARIQKLDIKNPSNQAQRDALSITDQVISENYLFTLIGPCCFYKVSSLAWPKDWGVEITPYATIGSHTFYNLP